MSQAETKSSTSRRKALTAIAGIAGSAVVATSAIATAAAKPDSGLSDLDYHAALKRFQSMIASLRIATFVRAGMAWGWMKRRPSVC